MKKFFFLILFNILSLNCLFGFYQNWQFKGLGENETVFKKHKKKKKIFKKIIKITAKFFEKEVSQFLQKELNHLLKQIPKMIEKIDLQSKTDLYFVNEFILNELKSKNIKATINVEIYDSKENKSYFIDVCNNE
ncbi:TPA: hypothetical protein DEO28_04550 [Candidatus Dependentiae bacterium]|nr:MAG: hypothetical protein UR14_C0002G0028 [candidate division TM6 bacterium GW2011_GWE2_31_21]KKP53825.1 MAG: hypothetical protein UR43_C0002G0028 [candidate division TM6 bacterium GW2011_GWF2_33_332]HBS47605.1 hypothetical protein [Candidatus Dependentiae bacterium]HBZ73754.1 hypothetical protein [Candidatus Dependentiae bacterium]